MKILKTKNKNNNNNLRKNENCPGIPMITIDRLIWNTIHSVAICFTYITVGVAIELKLKG